jgi:hypothetical protein
MAGINKQFLISEIAGVCRGQWATKDWGHNADDQPESAPEIPEDPTEIINQYFDSVRWTDDDEDFDPQAFSYCDWENIDIDLAVIPGDVIDLSVDSPVAFTVTRDAEGHAECQGQLLPGYGEVSDALESFVLALVAAGAPVWHPHFKEALQTVADALANNLDDEEPEEMERELVANDLTLILEPDVEHCEASWMLSGPSYIVKPLLDPLDAYSWSTRAEALRAAYNAITKSSDA